MPTEAHSAVDVDATWSDVQVVDALLLHHGKVGHLDVFIIAIIVVTVAYDDVILLIVFPTHTVSFSTPQKMIV